MSAVLQEQVAPAVTRPARVRDLHPPAWVRHRDAALADPRHPVLGPLYGTLPGGLLVLAIVVWSVGRRGYWSRPGPRARCGPGSSGGADR